MKKKKTIIPAHLNVDSSKARVVPQKDVLYRGKTYPSCMIEFIPRIGFLKLFKIGDTLKITKFYYSNRDFDEYVGCDLRDYLSGEGQFQISGMEELLTDILSKSRITIDKIEHALN